MRYSAQTDRTRDRHANRTGRKAFCGVDGEGGNFDTGHEYMLLRAGEYVLETGNPLTWQECLGFLASLPKDRIYVAYFFDYDVTMMLRGLRSERLRRLLDMNCRRIPDKPCSSFPINVPGYQIDYIPGKEFRVRRWIPGQKKREKWTIINDTGSFFQASFVTTLRKWFSPDDEPDLQAVIDQIAKGKQQRNEFGAVTQEEREYNYVEIRMLEMLMNRFRDLCDSLNIRPTKWQGPGNLVSAVFRQNKLPPNKDITLFDTMPEFMLAANAAYYGGRFEAAQIGHIPGPVYQYDINSAYANTYKDLPCLVHGTWKPIQRLPSDGIYLAEVEFNHSADIAWCTLPIRIKSGSLVFPRKGRGIYWSPELQVARKHGVKLKFIRGWRYINQCDCSHFDFVYDLYRKRAELGKDARGMVLKITLASMYGKLAQSVGCAPYANPVWAGLITSMVRAQLADAALAMNMGIDVLMLATDGLFTTCRIDSLDVGDALGQWSLTIHKEMFAVQSGVYFLSDAPMKTRGVPKSRVEAFEDTFRDDWSQYVDAGGAMPHVSIPLNVFIGLRLALARNKPDTAGQWMNVTKDISFDWRTKRVECRMVDYRMTTIPMEGSANLVSVAYDRVIGGLRNAERLTAKDQPDWADKL